MLIYVVDLDGWYRHEHIPDIGRDPWWGQLFVVLLFHYIFRYRFWIYILDRGRVRMIGHVFLPWRVSFVEDGYVIV